MSNDILFNLEAEAAALGCVLLADGDAHEMIEQLYGLLTDRANTDILKAADCLEQENWEVDVPSLLNYFRVRDAVGSVGGEGYIITLPDRTPSKANFPTYLAILRECEARRRMFNEGEAIQKRALDSAFKVECGRDELLVSRRFNPDIEPPALRPVYSLAGTAISTPGNLTTITSAVKTGKSAVISAMAASAMPHNADADLLSFSSNNPQGLGVCWFDSEQSTVDFWHCVARAPKRVGLQRPPAWLNAYCLTGLGHKKAWPLLLQALRKSKDTFGGIHSTLIDGAADFIADVNDPEESNDFVSTLHGLAMDYDCPIVTVIHFNPGSDKSRGHLGSQLERKAETNLSLEKEDDTTVIFSSKNRRASISKDLGPRFRFSEAAGMHISCETRRLVKESAERESLQLLVGDVFEERPSMRYSDIQVTVKKLLTVSAKTAQRKVDRMRALAVIKQSVAGLYIPSSKTST